MGWSYSGDPSNSDKDHVRFLIQDTDKDDQLMSDSEIEFLLAEGGNPTNAAIRAVEGLMAKFARLCDEKVGQVSQSLSQKYSHYSQLLKTLKRRSALTNVAPFAGGITESQKDVQENNQDRVDPFFTRDMHDYVESENERTGRAIDEGIQEEGGA